MAGDTRALARAIRMVEDRDPGIADLLRQIRGRAGLARVVGVTGPPGSGKSTLCDQVIERWRAAGHQVGVIAVDPSSPFTGGAILGDRVRMVRHTLDPGVFIRSMAARGHLGGLAAAAREAIRLLDAAGRDRCLLETVGVGQSELEVMETADTTIVVTTPSTGDAVQIIKAGILEIADIFVVNKADLPGASKVVRDLKELVRHGALRTAWAPPVLTTIAETGEGVDELVAAIEQHGDAISASGELERRRIARLRAEVEAIVVERSAERARRALHEGTMSSRARRRSEPGGPVRPGRTHPQRAQQGINRAMTQTIDRAAVPPGRPDKPRQRSAPPIPPDTLGGLPLATWYGPDTSPIDVERDLGEPGSFPYTRGVHRTMYRDKVWTMRQFAGFGSARDTNERYRFLLDQGQMGLSVAFDMPTLMGHDFGFAALARRGGPLRGRRRLRGGHAHAVQRYRHRGRDDVHDHQLARANSLRDVSRGGG